MCNGNWAKWRNSNAFCQFLALMMTAVYPTHQIVLVMDNASFHTGQMTQAGLSLYEQRLSRKRRKAREFIRGEYVTHLIVK